MRHLFLLLVAGLLVGCQSAFYHPFDGYNGYSDSPVRPDVFEVSYVGTSRMTNSDARYYATVRAAEIGLTMKKSWMEVMEEERSYQGRSRYVPGSGAWYYGGPGWYGGAGWRHHSYYYYDYPGYYEAYYVPAATIQVRFAEEKTDKTLNIRDTLTQANQRGVMINESTKRELGLPAR